MKKILWIIAVLILTSCQVENISNNSGDDTNPDYYNDYPDYDGGSGLTYQTFYDQLSPYGSWMNYGDYGYVWVPGQSAGFVPYLTNGYWIYTDYGWTWASDFNWGWAPFHYGTWLYDDIYGWIWVPGYNWAPAWVIWGNYGDYYCWAPIGPRQVISPHYRPRNNHWNIIRHNNVTQHDLPHHCEDNSHFPDMNDHVSIIDNSGTFHQGVYFTGPKKDEVEKYSGQKITAINISTVKQPQTTTIRNNQLQMFRPEINKVNPVQKSAPAKIAKPANNNPVDNIRNNTPPVQNNPVRQREPQPYNPPVQQRNISIPKQPAYKPPVQTPSYHTEPVQRQPDKGFVPYQNPAPVQQRYVQPSSPAPQRNMTPANNMQMKIIPRH